MDVVLLLPSAIDDSRPSAIDLILVKSALWLGVRQEIDKMVSESP